jgi:hypothetical protein
MIWQFKLSELGGRDPDLGAKLFNVSSAWRRFSATHTTDDRYHTVLQGQDSDTEMERRLLPTAFDRNYYSTARSFFYSDHR